MKFKQIYAVYEQCGRTVVFEYCDYFNGKYPRLSEILEAELEFKMLSDGEVIGNQVSILDKQIDEIKTEAMQKVSTLETKKQELLAITHEVNDE